MNSKSPSAKLTCPLTGFPPSVPAHHEVGTVPTQHDTDMREGSSSAPITDDPGSDADRLDGGVAWQVDIQKTVMCAIMEASPDARLRKARILSRMERLMETQIRDFEGLQQRVVWSQEVLHHQHYMITARDRELQATQEACEQGQDVCARQAQSLSEAQDVQRRQEGDLHRQSDEMSAKDRQVLGLRQDVAASRQSLQDTTVERDRFASDFDHTVMESFRADRPPCFLARFRGLNETEAKAKKGRLRMERASQHDVVFRPGPGQASSHFAFDRVFYEGESNADIHRYLRPMIETIRVHRVNVILILDGHSGAGKTFTMFTGPDPVVMKCAEQIFGWRASRDARDEDLCVSFASQEVYCGKARDLLADESRVSTPTPGASLPAGGHLLHDYDDLVGMFEKVKSSRKQRKMRQNQESSRSHAIHTLSLSWQGGKSTASLKLVDLAGNEETPEGAHPSGSRQQTAFAEQKKEHDYIKESRTFFQATMMARASGESNQVTSAVCTLLL